MCHSIACSNIPAISAIYYALLQSGYDYYHLGREAEHITAIQNFVGTERVPPFFNVIRQSTCEAYPYWPRAAILETATFCMKPNLESFENFVHLQKQIMSATNIAECERGNELWDWIVSFPKALQAILSSNGFLNYMEWERQWIDTQNQVFQNELQQIQACLNICKKVYQSPIQDIQMIINPIKCVYSADYHMNGTRLVFSSGSFQLESVVHEFLHHVVHPHILSMEKWILQTDRAFSNIDNSYYLSGDRAGKLNAFEEYAVRELTKRVIVGDYPTSISKYIKNLCEKM